MGSGELWVGPYQGKVACLFIGPGKGVCGASFEKQKTLIVPDVHQFPGHIACDSLACSEIVLPVRHGGKSIGVLDLDSHAYGAFDEGDEKGLLRLLDVLERSTS